MRSLSKIVWGSLAVIAVIHGVATLYSWYWIYTWIDIPMHFIGGVWVALLFFWIFQMRNDVYLETIPTWLSAAIVIGFTLLLGVLWEFFEFSYDFFVAQKGFAELAQQGLTDTIGDLAMDFLGGAMCWGAWYTRARKSSPHLSPLQKP